MTVLGISAFYHDSAACLVVDGRIVAAAQEERFTRIRHDAAFPYNAVMYCLNRQGITHDDIDCVVFYEKPLIKLERILQNAVEAAPRGIVAFSRSMPSWFSEKLNVPRVLRKEIQYRGPVRYALHHQAHAAAAFLLSPFDEAAVMTIDGVGEWTTASIGVGRGNRIELLKEIRYPHSLGLLYSAFTEFLGFKVNSDEYKVMGLAPYGDPVFVDKIRKNLIEIDEDGGFELNLKYFDFMYGSKTAGAGFEKLFGCAGRRPESKLEQIHMDIARSIQAVTETVMLRQADFAKRVTGMDRLCMAGGVSLNCVANGRILDSGLFRDIWIQPAAGDAGGAAGAAMLGWYQMSGADRIADPADSMSGALLGPEYDDDAIRKTLSESDVDFVDCGEGIYDEIAGRLASGQVVARFAGRMEFGPRALGSRSILADARNPAMQKTVNEKIKFREGFRPFAPAVLEEKADQWFELKGTSPYMLLVSQVHADKMLDTGIPEPSGLDRLKIARSGVPAVTHVDGSARIQTVSADRHPDFRNVIEAFDRLTGCPVVLNTSFNLRGQPIVRTPSDAVQTFLACDLDALAAGPFLVTKPGGWTRRSLPKTSQFRRTRRIAELRRFGIENGVFFTLLGLLAWFAPDNPLKWLSLAAWSIATVALGAGIAAPGLLRRPEHVMHSAGARMNGGMGGLLFGLVHVLFVTPTALVRRARGAKPERGGWSDVKPDEHGGFDNMY